VFAEPIKDATATKEVMAMSAYYIKIATSKAELGCNQTELVSSKYSAA